MALFRKVKAHCRKFRHMSLLKLKSSIYGLFGKSKKWRFFVRFLKNDITLCFSDFRPQICLLFFEKVKVALFLKGRVYCRKSHHFFDFSIITFCGQKHVLSFFNISIFSPGYRAFIKGRVTVLKGLNKLS